MKSAMRGRSLYGGAATEGDKSSGGSESSVDLHSPDIHELVERMTSDVVQLLQDMKPGKEGTITIQFSHNRATLLLNEGRRLKERLQTSRLRETKKFEETETERIVSALNRAISEVTACFKDADQSEVGELSVDVSKTAPALNNLMTALKELAKLLDDDVPVGRAVEALAVGFDAIHSVLNSQGAQIRELREIVEKLSLHTFNSKKANHGEPEFLRFRAPVLALEGRILVILEKYGVEIDWKSIRGGADSKQGDNGEKESLFLLREWFNSPSADAVAKQKTMNAFVYLFGEYGRNIPQVLDNMLAVSQQVKKQALPTAHPTNVTSDEIRGFIDVLVANSQLGKTEIEKFLKYCDLAADKPEFRDMGLHRIHDSEFESFGCWS